MNLSALGTFTENATHRATLTVYNNPCSPSHTTSTCVYILPPLLRGININPNPSSDFANLNFDLVEDVKELSIQLYPVTAKSNYKELLKVKNKIKGEFNQQIDLSNLTPGIYTIEIIADGNSYSRNLSVIK